MHEPGSLTQVMMVSNIDVEAKFANGTQGRLLCWAPEKAETRKAIQASHPEIFVRFVKENSLKKRELLADVDRRPINRTHGHGPLPSHTFNGPWEGK